MTRHSIGKKTDEPQVDRLGRPHGDAFQSARKSNTLGSGTGEADLTSLFKAAIARIQLQTPVFIGVSVSTRRVRPQLHPRATAAHGRGPLSPGGVRAGRVTPEQNAPPLRHQPPSRTTPLG